MRYFMPFLIIFSVTRIFNAQKISKQTMKHITHLLLTAAIAAMLLFPNQTNANSNDPMGLSGKTVLIQSAVEYGRTDLGYWDLPGTPGVDNGNLTGTIRLPMRVMRLDKNLPEDSVFRFEYFTYGGKGSRDDMWKIKIGRSGNWEVFHEKKNVISAPTISTTEGVPRFQLDHLGGGRFHIYYRAEMVTLTPAIINPNQRIRLGGSGSNTVTDDTKLVLVPHAAGKNDPRAVWVCIDTETSKSIIPADKADRPYNRLNNELERRVVPELKKDFISTKYFEVVSASRFTQENSGRLIHSALEQAGSSKRSAPNTSDQWKMLYHILNYTSKNKSIESKRAIYKALSEAKYNTKANTKLDHNTRKDLFYSIQAIVTSESRDIESKKSLDILIKKFK